jgi:hypothetical protein
MNSRFAPYLVFNTFREYWHFVNKETGIANQVQVENTYVTTLARHCNFSSMQSFESSGHNWQYMSIILVSFLSLIIFMKQFGFISDNSYSLIYDWFTRVENEAIFGDVRSRTKQLKVITGEVVSNCE